MRRRTGTDAISRHHRRSRDRIFPVRKSHPSDRYEKTSDRRTYLFYSHSPRNVLLRKRYTLRPAVDQYTSLSQQYRLGNDVRLFLQRNAGTGATRKYRYGNRPISDLSELRFLDEPYRNIPAGWRNFPCRFMEFQRFHRQPLPDDLSHGCVRCDLLPDPPVLSAQRRAETRELL